KVVAFTQRHDSGSRRNAGEYATSAITGDNSGHFRSVAFGIHGIACVVWDIDAEHIVHVAIVIVIALIRLLAWTTFPRIGPHFALKVLMRVIDARIEHGHNHWLASYARCQGFCANLLDVPRDGRAGLKDLLGQIQMDVIDLVEGS